MSVAPKQPEGSQDSELVESRETAGARTALSDGALRASAYHAPSRGRQSGDHLGGDAAEGRDPPQAGPAAAATPGPSMQPPDVSRGLETHTSPFIPPEGVFVRLDWIRATAPESERSAMVDLCVRHCGYRWRVSKGARFFTEGRDWDTGAQVSYGHSAKIAMLDLRGSLLSALTADEGIGLLREVVTHGWKLTRLDGALDFVGQSLGIVDNARASGHRDEQCILRLFHDDYRRQSKHHECGKQATFGRRDSDVCVRFYDKGLEQRLLIANFWERIEAEWKGDRAPLVAARILSAGDAWHRVLTELIVGAVDFREVNGRTEIDRRSRAAWWADLLSGLQPTKTSPIPRNSEFDRWLYKGLRPSYGRKLLQMKLLSGMSWDALMELLTRSLLPAEEMDAVVNEFLSAHAG